MQGGLLYHSEGLDQPQAVQVATEEYRRAENPVGLFLEECCVITGDENDYVQNDHLYGAYSTWCEQYGHLATTNHKSLAEVRKL